MAGVATIWGSLSGRRTANAQIETVDWGFREDFFFLQQADSGKKRLDVIRNWGRRCAEREHAEGACDGFGLVSMVVQRLRDCCPQHQGQTKPCHQPRRRSHTFLHWNKSSLAYNGCMVHDNAGKVIWKRTDSGRSNRYVMTFTAEYAEFLSSEDAWQNLVTKN